MARGTWGHRADGHLPVFRTSPEGKTGRDGPNGGGERTRHRALTGEPSYENLHKRNLAPAPYAAEPDRLERQGTDTRCSHPARMRPDAPAPQARGHPWTANRNSYCAPSKNATSALSASGSPTWWEPLNPSRSHPPRLKAPSTRAWALTAPPSRVSPASTNPTCYCSPIPPPSRFCPGVVRKTSPPACSAMCSPPTAKSAPLTLAACSSACSTRPPRWASPATPRPKSSSTCWSPPSSAPTASPCPWTTNPTSTTPPAASCRNSAARP